MLNKISNSTSRGLRLVSTQFNKAPEDEVSPRLRRDYMTQ